MRNLVEMRTLGITRAINFTSYLKTRGVRSRRKENIKRNRGSRIKNAIFLPSTWKSLSPLQKENLWKSCETNDKLQKLKAKWKIYTAPGDSFLFYSFLISSSWYSYEIEMYVNVSTTPLCLLQTQGYNNMEIWHSSYFEHFI